MQSGGDAGELTNQLVLTKGSPVADVVFGIDTTFASRAVSEGVLAAHTPADLPASAEEHLLEGGETVLTPVDHGDVCVNVDDVWFANRGIAPPESLEDLTEPEYEDLFVTPGATTSSPGMAFLLATVGYFGQGEWQAYWQDLMDNGARVTSGWTDAYTVDFTAGGGEGDRPIVLSYASSPPFTIPEGGWQPTTRALLDTCFRQVEYAGVLEGAVNPEGARAVVDWLVSPEVQAAIPESMFMYPVDDEVVLPELWAEWAPLPDDPIVVHPGQIEAERESWLREWADIATG
jgi:thiamine transport system substrate-binding protein